MQTLLSPWTWWINELIQLASTTTNKTYDGQTKFFDVLGWMDEQNDGWVLWDFPRGKNRHTKGDEREIGESGKQDVFIKKNGCFSHPRIRTDTEEKEEKTLSFDLLIEEWRVWQNLSARQILQNLEGRHFTILSYSNEWSAVVLPVWSSLLSVWSG